MMRRIALGVVGLIAVLAVWDAVTFTPSIASESGIAEERRLDLGGVEQYVLIRGTDRAKPIMLFVHGGPGTSAMAFNRVFSHELEKDFVFVNWDQRGTGFSYAAGDDESAITLEQIVRDLDELVDALLAEFEQPSLILVGYSWGSLVSLEYVSRFPSKVSAYVGIGQMADTPASEKLVYQWALDQARQAADKASLEILEAIGSPPYRNVGDMMKHRGVVGRYGGAWVDPMSDIKYAITAIRAREFSWLGLRDILRGGDRSLSALYSAFSEFDALARYPTLDVPVYFFHGRRDRVVSPEPAKRYLEALEAPAKEWVWFEDSAHNPHWEEIEKYRTEVLRVTGQ